MVLPFLPTSVLPLHKVLCFYTVLAFVQRVVVDRPGFCKRYLVTRDVCEEPAEVKPENIYKLFFSCNTGHYDKKLH